METLRQKIYKQAASEGKLSKRADKQRDTMYQEEIDKALGKS